MGSVWTGICAFFYMSNLFGVVVFHRSMVDWRRGWGLSALVSVHSSICETAVSVVVFHRSMVRLEEGVGSVCTGVVVFHRSMVNWRRGWGLSALVYVHSSICETYSV